MPDLSIITTLVTFKVMKCNIFSNLILLAAPVVWCSTSVPHLAAGQPSTA